MICVRIWEALLTQIILLKVISLIFFVMQMSSLIRLLDILGDEIQVGLVLLKFTDKFRRI